MSSLTLPVDPALLAAHRATAERAAGPDYRMVRWEGRTPEHWRNDLATLRNRMITDAPSGKLEIREEHRTAARAQSG